MNIATPRHRSTGTKLTDDRRYRLAVIRSWASDDEGDEAADAYVLGVAAELAAEYEGVDAEGILMDWMAGTLWGFDRRDTCYGCDTDEYAPTCPSCQLDAGVNVGGPAEAPTCGGCGATGQLSACDGLGWACPRCYIECPCERCMAH